MTLQTRLSEIEESHVDAAFLALSKLRDSFVADGLNVENIDSAIASIALACGQRLYKKGTENEEV